MPFFAWLNMPETKRSKSWPHYELRPMERKINAFMRPSLKAERPLFFLSKMSDLSEMSQNGQNVRNVPKRAKCPKCPGTGEMS